MLGRRGSRPLLVVFTGDGKGKSTAAFGMVLRAWAHGLRVGVFQFVKSGRWPVGEEKAARCLGGIAWACLGEGWTWTSRNLSRAREMARAGWERVKEALASGEFDMVVLDELTYPMNLGWLDSEEVVRDLLAGRGSCHVVVTGRDAPGPLVQAADLVTEMRKVKHPFDRGVRGQPGIEW